LGQRGQSRTSSPAGDSEAENIAQTQDRAAPLCHETINSLEHRGGFSSESGRGPAFADYGFTETLHFFELRAQLKQHQVNASSLKCS